MSKLINSIRSLFLFRRPENKLPMVIEDTKPSSRVEDVEIINGPIDKSKLLSRLDLDSFKSEPNIINHNGTKTLLVVNDIQSTIKLLELDLKALAQEQQNDLIGKYKIVICSGKHATIVAYKYIKTHKIDKALVDVILTDTFLDIDGTTIEFSGFDIAKEIRIRNEKSTIGIFTSLPYNNIPKSIIESLRQITNVDIDKLIDKYILVGQRNRKQEIWGMLSTS